MPPRLLHVFPTFAIGGMQTQFATVANALGGAFRHAIVALDGRTQCRAKLDPGTPHEFLDPPPAVAKYQPLFAAVESGNDRGRVVQIADVVELNISWGVHPLDLNHLAGASGVVD